jgi:hypothetical protein
MTDGRLAFSSASAICGTSAAGSAIAEAAVVQNFRKSRLETPLERRYSPTVVCFMAAFR